MDYLWVGLGGFLGANARYALGLWISSRAGASFPWETLIINASGSLAIGFLLALLAKSLMLDSVWRLFLVVGFLGGYTTFSSYSWEAIVLMQRGQWAPAIGYILGSNGLSLGSTVLGILVGRSIIR